MAWIFALVGVLLVVGIALVVVGRETARLAAQPRPAVFDVTEAVEWIADRLSPDAQARLTHGDVRWVLDADADLLEAATLDPSEGRYPWTRVPAPAEGDADPDRTTVDEDVAVARILAAAEREGRDLDDADVAEVLEVRTAYLVAVGAIGDPVDAAGEPDEAPPAP